jgi:hypothetical protein
MVRSCEGALLYGNCWWTRYVWSTWSSFATAEEAERERADIGSETTIIHESQYVEFCASHTVW